MAEIELTSNLLRLLTCPVTGDKLVYDRKNKELISEKAGLAYPIIDGIPIMLADKARRMNRTATPKEQPNLSSTSANSQVKLDKCISK